MKIIMDTTEKPRKKHGEALTILFKAMRNDLEKF